MLHNYRRNLTLSPVFYFCPLSWLLFFSSAAVANHTPTASAQNSLSLSDEQIRASILSAVEDKMRRRLKDIFAQASAEMTALNRTQADLQKGKNTLDEMMQKLEREQVRSYKINVEKTYLMKSSPYRTRDRVL